MQRESSSKYLQSTIQEYDTLQALTQMMILGGRVQPDSGKLKLRRRPEQAL